MDAETGFIEKETKSPVVETPVAAAKQTTTTQTTVTETATGRPKPAESHVLSLSVRSILALVVLVTICYMSIKGTEIKEPLYTLSVAITAFFFGQQKPKVQGI